MSDLWLVIDEMPAEVLAAAVIAASFLIHGATER